MVEKLDDLTDRILFSEEEIQAKVKELADKINKYYKGKEVVLICILRGAVIFLSDLMKHLKIPVILDFMSVSSYGDSIKSSGIVRIIKDTKENIADKNVLIIEDIVDTGLTYESLRKLFLSRDPKSVKICALLNKTGFRQVNIKIDFYGFKLKDEFVVGYGLDYKEYYRNVPYIFTPKKEYLTE